MTDVVKYSTEIDLKEQSSAAVLSSNTAVTKPFKAGRAALACIYLPPC